MTFGIIIGGKSRDRHLKRSGNFDLRDTRDAPISKMERDRVMVRNIRDGKIDRSLKRDAEIIQREHEAKRKEKNRENDKKELYNMKKEYGLLPEQLKARQRTEE